jgi:two-component system OmpR family response regulator
MNTHKSQILCVDSDPQTVGWISHGLSMAGVVCEIETARSGREGFNLINERRFDLCILEYALPDMTGVQLCALLRSMGRKLPMIFFTAMNRQVDRDKASAAGANEFISKPDDLEIFVDAVTHHLHKKRKIIAEPLRFHNYARAA